MLKHWRLYCIIIVKFYHLMIASFNKDSDKIIMRTILLCLQQSSYLEMCSPCGSSPGPSGAYMPMSSGTGHSHSRGSSLVEESNTLPEGYVPMAPVGNNGYVDMDPSHNHNGHFPDDLSHGGSSCSVTSGTPSTDLRFSEYHLDKVTSFLPPGDDLQARPARAYSIGSRPEPIKSHRKNRYKTLY